MRKCFFISFFFIWSSVIFGQHDMNVWKQLTKLNDVADLWVRPANGKYFEVDFGKLQDILRQGKGTIAIPVPDGSIYSFAFNYTPCAEQGLFRKMDEAGTYTISDLNDRHINGRIDYTVRGFHAMFFLDGRTVLIDPVFRGRTDVYAVYYKDEYYSEAGDIPSFQCDQVHLEDDVIGVDLEEEQFMLLRELSQTLDHKTYRIAIATTGEYSQFHGGTNELVLAELLTAVNRINTVLIRDAGVQLLLIENNDKIIFLDPLTDGFTNGETSIMIDQSPSRIGLFIKLDEYDVGHVFGVATNGNVGLAQLGSVCTTSKARGVSGLWTPKFDPFYVGVVAHELGHQFSATHTMNKCINENLGTGWEPGGGSTIMGYSGACGPNSVQGNSHDYYHGGSILQIRNFVVHSTGTTCGNSIPTENTAPAIQWPYTNNFSIPVHTPFRLEASATDDNQDVLTYCWENMDTGPSADAGDPISTSPLFRSYPPTSSPNRFFPRINYTLSKGYYKFEHLPTYSREMNFRLTVRDNNPETGAIAQKDIRFFAAEEAGPFRVTNLLQPTQLKQGEYIEITWDVANTDQAPVNCKGVNIRMSTDGGNTYPIIVAQNLPNTGAAWINVPKVNTNTGRFMVEAADNIFFHINGANFTITQAESPGLIVNVTPVQQRICIPDLTTIELNLDTVANFSGALTFELRGDIPPGIVSWFSGNSNEYPRTVQAFLDVSGVTKGGTYHLELVTRDGQGQEWVRNAIVELVRNDYSSLDAITPLSGTANVSTSPLLSWVAQEDAQNYMLEVATSPAFGSTVVFSLEGITSTSHQIIQTLASNKVFFWRVLPKNICGAPDEVPIYAFSTKAISCNNYTSAIPVTIPAQGTHKLTSVINVPVSGSVSSIYIPEITGNHQNIGHLRMSIINPEGDTARLFSNKCINLFGNFKFGINDESLQPFECPPDKGHIYKGQTSLSALSGSDVKGDWTLYVEDVATGGGGNITKWTIGLCSEINPIHPNIWINNEMIIAPLSAGTIIPDLLWVTDANNHPWELEFIVVKVPEYGHLLFLGLPLQVGSTFTQQDIFDGNITYQDVSGTEQSDSFEFVVRDPEGGWAGIDRFNFRTEKSNVTLNPDDLTTAVMVFPNPVSNQLQLVFEHEVHGFLRLHVINTMGQVVIEEQIPSGIRQWMMDTSKLTVGSYFLRLFNQSSMRAFRFDVMR